MTFTSPCVDVILMESPPWIQQFWLVTRPCEEDCGYRHCPHWERAILSLGDWAVDTDPVWSRESDSADGDMEYMFSRVIMPAEDDVATRDHRAWEYANIEDLVPRACSFLQMGLDLGHEGVVVAHSTTARLIQEYPGFAPYVDRVHWRDVLDTIATSGEAGPTALAVAALAEKSKVWLFTDHLGWHDNWDSAMASEAIINRMAAKYDMAVACAVPDLSHELGGAYPRICQQHARMVVV